MTLNNRQTTYVNDSSPLAPTVLRNATVLHFDHPEVTNQDSSVTCHRSSLYFPLCAIWGNPTAVTYLLRFRLDAEQFLKTDGAWDYCNILTSDWEYNGAGGNGFKIWVKPTEANGQIYFCHGNRMEGSYINTGLSLTDTAHPVRSENWAELAIIVKDSHTVRFGLALPGSVMQWVDKSCTDVASLLPRENWSIMLGGDGGSGDTAQSHLECTRMSMHMFAAWTRALSDREVIEAFSDTGMAVLRAGCAGAASQAFAADGTADIAFDSTSANWRSLPTVLPAGRSVAFSFTPDAGYVGLPQLARVTAAASSQSGTVEVQIDGVPVGTASVMPGKTSSIYVPGASLGAGSHTLAFKSVSGNLVIDVYELSGSRALGRHGCHWHDKGGGPAAFDLECGNLKNMSHGAGQELVLTLSADVARSHKFTYRTYFAEGAGVNSMTLTVNGRQKLVVENPSISDTRPVSVEFDPGELLEGENVFRWTLNGSWVIFDDHVFSVGKKMSGMVVVFR